MTIYVIDASAGAGTRSGSASANEIVADASAHLPAELTEVVIAERSARRRCGNPHHPARPNRRTCGDDHPITRACADLAQLVGLDDQTIFGHHRFECGIGCHMPNLPQVLAGSGRTPGKRLISQRGRFSSLQTGSSAKSLPDPTRTLRPRGAGAVTHGPRSSEKTFQRLATPDRASTLRT